jgi:hypothetical protein
MLIVRVTSGGEKEELPSILCMVNLMKCTDTLGSKCDTITSLNRLLTIFISLGGTKSFTIIITIPSVKLRRAKEK